MSVVTRWLPRTVLSAWRKRSLRDPVLIQQLLHADGLGFRSMARNRCSTETYSSPMALASSSALTSALFRYWPMYGCPPWTFTRAFSASFHPVQEMLLLDLHFFYHL